MVAVQQSSLMVMLTVLYEFNLVLGGKTCLGFKGADVCLGCKGCLDLDAWGSALQLLAAICDWELLWLFLI
jgi:hypothetical protein